MSDGENPTSDRSPVNMGRLMQLAWGFAPVHIIQAGIETGTFTALKSGPLSSAQIAQATGCSERGIEALVNALLALRLLERSAEARVQLTPESSTFLANANPETSLLSFFSQLTQEAIPNWTKLTESVRTGRPAIAVNTERHGAPFFAAFAESLFPLSYPAARALAQQLARQAEKLDYRVLDLGAGAAVWSIPIAQALPSARITAVDWPQVLTQVTSQFVARYGLGAQYELLSGDVLEVHFGDGYDVAIAGLLLHTEGEPRSRALLKKIYEALRPGGQVVLVEFLVDREREQSLDGLLFALNMLVHSDLGTTWSYEELSGWLIAEGFEDITALKLPRPSPVIVGRKPV